MLIFRQKSFQFCIPRLKTRQPVLPQFQSLTLTEKQTISKGILNETHSHLVTPVGTIQELNHSSLIFRVKKGCIIHGQYVLQCTKSCVAPYCKTGKTRLQYILRNFKTTIYLPVVLQYTIANRVQEFRYGFGYQPFLYLSEYRHEIKRVHIRDISSIHL